MEPDHSAGRPVPSLDFGKASFLALVAAAMHGAADWLSLRAPWAVPPHLLLPYVPEGFRGLSPVAVSVAFSVANGALAAVLLAALAPSLRSGTAKPILLFGAVLWAFWVASGGLLAAVWLSAPWPIVASGLAFGLPRSLLVAFPMVKVWAAGAARAGGA